MALKMTGLQRFRADLDKTIDQAVFDTAQDMVTLMRQITPVDEGDLRSSDRVEPDAPDGGAVYAVRSGGVSGPNKFVDYAEYVEEDQPFFAPAVEAIDLQFRLREALTALAKRSQG